MTENIGWIGYAPVVTVQKERPPEQDIYKELWTRDEYRAVSPGEECASIFLAQAKPPKGATCIDFGCGTGRGSLALALFGGLDVTMVDFADNCLDADIRPMLETQKHALRFVQADLTKDVPVASVYGYCTDVMEHIASEQVDTVLSNILHAAQHVFFVIATEEDNCGAMVGHPLHLTVQPYEWWLAKFNALDCTIHWSKDADGHCLFYVSAWVNGQQIVDAGELNTPEEQILANVKGNIDAGWQQVEPHEANDVEVMLVGGGPSLAEQEPTIRKLRADGVKLICLNGAYNWCLERGIKPSAVVVVDARAFNARFTHPVIDDCKYFVASQCHSSVLEGLPKERTYLWHTSTETIRDILQEKCDRWWGIPGGSTVLLRAIPLFRMLGFKRFHLFGCDSCVTNKHHAYAQAENDEGQAFPVNVGGKTFMCHPWMAAQAHEFMETIKFLGNEVELAVYGDGLLNHILQTGAAMEA